MLSQAGPSGSRALTALPTAPEFRLSLVLPSRVAQTLAAARATGSAGVEVHSMPRVLRMCGAALERVAARVFREASVRVATNVFLRDMNVDVPLDGGRRIEVLANGLPLWQGAQAAVDTTLVSHSP